MNITETTPPVPNYELRVAYERNGYSSATWRWAIYELSAELPYGCRGNLKASSRALGCSTRWGATIQAKRALRRLIRRRTRLYTVTLEEKS